MRSIIMEWMQGRHSAISQFWARWQGDSQAQRPVAGPLGSGRASPAITSRIRPERSEKIVVVRMDSRPGPLSEALYQTGYQVVTVQGLAGARASLEHGSPDLVIVSGPEATETCAALRRDTTAPVLALLPELTEPAVLAAFDAGADDCQLVTIGAHEAILRVAALLRRDQQRSAYRMSRPATS